MEKNEYSYVSQTILFSIWLRIFTVSTNAESMDALWYIYINIYKKKVQSTVCL